MRSTRTTRIKSFNRTALRAARGASLGFALLSGACGGSGDGAGGITPMHPPTPMYTLGGSISGLANSGLVLANGTDELTVAANATVFTMGNAVALGGSYAVTVKTSPSGLMCTVTNGSGTVTGNVSNVAVRCGVPTVSTLAGSIGGFADGDGTAAQFYGPHGVTVDREGNAYVADTFNHRIRKITAAGVVSTLAGSGTSGWYDATGTLANFREPYGIAVDGLGVVYVATPFEARIRKVTTAGVVSTLAGQSVGIADGTGSEAQFNQPYGVAVDEQGHAYVADSINNRIRKISPTGAVSTLAGSANPGTADGTAAQFDFPTSVAVDGQGNIYVADTGNNRIRKITPAGVVSTLAGNVSGFADGTGSAASFLYPWGVAVDSAGNVYVADSGNHRIRKVTPAGVVSTLAGDSSGFADGAGSAARFDFPRGVAVDRQGNVYVADGSNHRIRKISP